MATGERPIVLGEPLAEIRSATDSGPHSVISEIAEVWVTEAGSATAVAWAIVVAWVTIAISETVVVSATIAMSETVVV